MLNYVIMTKVFLRKFIAIGQKTQEDTESFGRGFNYWVEVGFPLSETFDRLLAARVIDDVLGQIDHKALGVDVDLGINPTSQNLCVWIANEIACRWSSKQRDQLEIRLLRGDGLVVHSQLLGSGGTARPPAVNG
jgi:hypothetical protein